MPADFILRASNINISLYLYLKESVRFLPILFYDRLHTADKNFTAQT